MGLESSTYVNGLNASNPAATDGLAQADDHMRLIKSTLTNTFPNLNDEVLCTPAELNVLNTSDVTTESLNKLEDVTATADELNILAGATATTDEVNYLSGVTSNIQDQLDDMTSATDPTFTGTITLGNWSISQGTDGRLDFAVGSTTVFSIDTTGHIRANNDVSAFDSAT